MKRYINISALARENDVARSTLERVLKGETKNPRTSTIRILQAAGLVQPKSPLLIPGNIRSFGQDISLHEVERLMDINLKPINLATPEELTHLLAAMREFPDLYYWEGGRVD